MIRSLDDLRNYQFEAEDGELGRVRDFYFDDEYWVVRYLVLETGRWLPGRTVLIAPQSIREANREERRIHLDLTYEAVKNSPEVDEHLPVSRQREKELHDYYAWSPYWMAGPSGLETLVPVPASARAPEPSEEKEQDDEGPDSRLRSVKAVTGYGVLAKDGPIGEVRDFACEEDTWALRYLLIDTRKFLRGRPVLVAPDWVKRFDWRQRKVEVDLTKDQLESSPLIDPAKPIVREDEEKLYATQSRPGYWQRANKGEA